MNIKVLWELLKESAVEWDKDKCPRLGAAISYYTLFSLAPVLIIAITIAGIIFGHEAAQGEIVAQIEGLVGRNGAEAVQTMLQNAYQSSDSTWATIIGVVTLIIGATGVFVELQDSLNTAWEVIPKPGRGIMGILKDRLLSFGVVLGVGFLLMVSLILSAAITAVNTYISANVAGTAFLWQAVNFILSFAVVTFLFAMIYRLLPDVKLDWKHVWVGGVVTAALFSIGKFVIGLYLGNSSVASAYGAAGSVVVLLVWVYYSAQIFLFGAEFTQVYARRFGKKVEPCDNAISVEGLARDGVAAREIAKEAIAAKVEADQKEAEAGASENAEPQHDGSGAGKANGKDAALAKNVAPAPEPTPGKRNG